MKRLIFLGILVFLMACEGDEDTGPDCSTVLCEANEFLFTYRDTAGNPLIGTQFVQDSFKLSSPSTTLYLKPRAFFADNQLPVFYHEVESGQEYILELSETESDTLQFTFTTVTANCCVDSTMQEFLLNGNPQNPVAEDSYVLIK